MLHQSKCGMRPKRNVMPVTMHVKTLSQPMDPDHLKMHDLGRELEAYLDKIASSQMMEEKPKPKPKPKRKGTKKKGSKKPKKKTSKKNKNKKMKGGAVRAGSVQNFVQK